MMEVPPSTFLEAQKLDLERSQFVVVNPGVSARPDGVFAGCPPADHEKHEQHGGEPNLRVIRGTSGTDLALPSSDTSGAYIVHEPWLGPSPEWQLVELQGDTSTSWVTRCEICSIPASAGSSPAGE
jgi:hypothetical protein